MIPEERGEAACEAAMRAARAFVSGAEDQPTSDWRAHLDHCGVCRDEYRAAVMTTARMGRQLREERRQVDEEQRRTRFRRLVEEAGAPQPGLSPTRLRLLIYPALLIAFWMVFQQGPPQRKATLWGTVEEGTARIADREWSPDSESFVLESGQLVEAIASSRVHIGSDKRDLWLLGPGRVLVESHVQQRLRLVAGSVEQAGPGFLYSPWGVVEVLSGRARIELEASGLAVYSLEGTTVLRDAGGEHRVEAGESFSSAL